MNAKMPLEYYVNITISDDKLCAFLMLTSWEDDLLVEPGQLEQLLQEHHIVHGIKRDELRLITGNPINYINRKTLVAMGTTAQDGRNGYIDCPFDLDDNRKKPAVQQDGSVNYKEMISLNNVRKGQKIATRVPADEGIPGKAVTGEQIVPKKGKDVFFKLGKNVVADGDNMTLYAAIDGLVTKTDRDKINVFPIFEVNGDIDYNIGNIDFVGTVVIRGSVLSGFKIKAAGDIRVTGGVEGADLEAEGSIEIGAGILGHNKGLIKANKDIKTSFIQEGNVQAGENVIVSQSIMHSQVRSGKNVVCSGAKGLIVGGVTQAGEKVTARTIGNTMSTATTIEVGVLPELRNELIELRGSNKTMMESLDKTEKALAILDQFASSGNLTADKLSLRVKLNATKRQTLEELNGVKERILEIEKSLEDTSKAKVEVLSMIYSGTKIVIGRFTRFIKDPTPRVSFQFIEGDITMSANI